MCAKKPSTLKMSAKLSDPLERIDGAVSVIADYVYANKKMTRSARMGHGNCGWVLENGVSEPKEYVCIMLDGRPCWMKIEEYRRQRRMIRLQSGKHHSRYGLRGSEARLRRHRALFFVH